MSDDLKALRERAASLPPGDWDEHVEVNEAILRLAPADLVATRRLALALVKTYQFARAEEVVDEALDGHPDDPILTKRSEDIVRGRRRAEVTRASAPTRELHSDPSTWIKVVHYDDDGWTEEEGAELWISDPGQHDARNNRVYNADGEPRGRPSWKVGEEAGVYFGGTQRIPMLLEIISAPEFNPAFVQQADWAAPGDGERWPWVTWFKVIRSVEVEMAPTLDDLGIGRSSVQRRARLLTTPEIHHRLRVSLGLC